MNDCWVTIPGTDGLYEISLYGLVRSLPRIVIFEHPITKTTRRQVHGCVLKPHKLKNGYWAVSVAKGGTHRKCYLHTLLMEVFGGKKPDVNSIVRHLDDNKDNNLLSNLAWGTRADNTADAFRNNRIPLGECSRHAKLTEASVKYIRAQITDGVSILTLARELGVNIKSIYQVKIGRTWKHV